MKIKILGLFILLASVLSPVYGYIDPGTGGMVLGSLGSLIAVVFAIIGGFLAKFFIHPIKKTISKVVGYLKSG